MDARKGNIYYCVCRDITGLGRWGNGDVELYMDLTSDVDPIMEIVEQSYRLQVDE